jgi:hypothetical protein
MPDAQSEIVVATPVATPRDISTLFGTQDPAAVVVKATAVAKALADVIDSRKLYTAISGRKHVRVEGWTLLGSMLGVFPVLVWCRRVDGGWEARVEARTLAGNLVGAAEAQCTSDERLWAQRDDFARRSMAQTRATSKALRLPLGFVIALAGYDATPAEEMVAEAEGVEVATSQSPTARKKPQAKSATKAATTPAHPAPESLSWTGAISDVLQKPNVNGKTIYTIKAGDIRWTTYSKTAAEDAKHAKLEELPVTITYHVETWSDTKSGEQRQSNRLDTLVVAGDVENVAKDSSGPKDKAMPEEA